MLKKCRKKRELPKRLLIAGGGTGGHVYPGIAICEAFLERYGQQSKVLFVGTRKGMESRLLPQYGYPLQLIEVQPLKGRSVWKQLLSIATLPSAGFQALKIINDFSPSWVLGVGGYASGPLLAVAAAKGIETAILEPNAIPGLTNRLLARVVKFVFAGLGCDGECFPGGKTWAVGTPIRQAIRETVERYSQKGELYKRYTAGEGERFRLLITGGSQGAHSLNRAVINALTFLNIPYEEIEILHQSGYADFEWVTKQYRSWPKISAQITPYIEKMSEAYQRAHLVIARAGASTLTELATMRRPAILVPYPNAADQHQLANARLLERAGAAKAVEEAQLVGHYLARLISDYYNEPDQLVAMSHAVGRFHNPIAAEQIIDILTAEKK